MAESERNATRIDLLVGFLVGTLTLGLSVFIVLRAMRSTLALATGQPRAALGNGQMSLMPIRAIQPSTLANEMQLPGGISLDTKADTVLLSTLGASRVFQAPQQGPIWLVRVQVLGPPGAFASFAVDTTPSADGAQSIVVPAGGFTELRLGARQILSGISINGNAQVSYVASAGVV